MNITDQDVYQGIVCIKIIKQLESLGYNEGINFISGTSKNSLVIGTSSSSDIGLYIKYTKKNNSPWSYSFHFDHQEEIKILSEICSEVFIAFVCGHDGVALISYQELKQLLDDDFEENERVSISRKPAGNYWLKGRDGKLEQYVTISDLGKKIYSQISIN